MVATKSSINKIGEIIRRNDNSAEFRNAIKTLNEWRKAHGPILDKYYDKCVRIAASIDKNIIVAQRLKRLPTIMRKLSRFPEMELARMQDIAGARIIVRNMSQFRLVEARLSKWKNLRHVKDYVSNPKNDGYRGKHFVYEKNGMYIEIQLRTQVQHLWATSIETVDIMQNSRMKERIENTYWRDFFCDVSSVFAAAEKQPMMVQHRERGVIQACEELRHIVKKHNIMNRLASYALSAKIGENDKKGTYYFVVSLDLKRRVATYKGFSENDYSLAVAEYGRREQEYSHTVQTVLVAVNQIKKIKEAYPNYFVDISAFLDVIKRLLDTYTETV